MNTIPALRNRFSLLALGALLGSFLLLPGCGKKQDGPKQMPPALPAMKVELSSASVTTDYSVRLEGLADAEIRPQVDGMLQAILVKEGDLVKKGQPLFKIDDSVYREQYNTALAAQRAAEAQAAVAKVNAEKLVPLVENKVVAPVQLTTAKAQEQAARALAAQAAASARSAAINLDYTVIKAPVAGYIGRIPYRQGNLLTKNQAAALTTLSDVNRMYAVFSISEAGFADFKKLYPGATLQQKIDAVPPVKLTLSDGTVYQHDGKLESISGDFDASTGSIRLRVSFPNPEGFLRSGNSGTVSLSSNYNHVILVPQSATVELQDKVMVTLLKPGNKVMKQVISVAGRSGPNYIVSEGLKPGDVIVTAGIERLQDGMVIKPLSAAAPGAPAPAAQTPNAR
ncbi:MAG TPA: efflux RND transporter periplasmic adaptor subunit [Chlorobaculum sp.]|uniref:Multidrug resistance protein, AcrA/AcrE family n=1 Tax=Chlorobaculum tepidum (strain ATCC 49652 / DSM 12025 / NBRC 103806 / TLS) TaxID=194439 RepID=Q8KCW9_CHLTE|nr:efflux RND transporter periplasmic adaptor subunit [Chlorobaculum tepidum]AAM72518.1 multidrug resistance protein, AcrA/AcrE family [Chlorobaculum tepidum TLS]HBU23599.1 efflux RND transporter periplasmic adaptor subunit [Chlorobaculum sp.]